MSLSLSLFLVSLASIMERADEALLPGAYREVGLALHASPSRLGSLTLMRSLVQASCFPLAAYASEFHHRPSVIAIGALTWSLATLLVGISTTFLQVACSRALNGIGLAIVVPAIQSVVADSTTNVNRGTAFGWLQVAGNVGSVIGGLCGVLLSGEIIFGVAGWRVAFFLVAFLSILVGILVYLFAVDPRSLRRHIVNSGTKRDAMGFISSVKMMFSETKQVIQIRTFQVIIAQGVAGSFPWAAMAFAPMWLETVGFSHVITALLVGVFVVAGSLGGLFGGCMGDLLARYLPNSGRIILAQVSSGLAVPLAAILLLGLPVQPAIPLLHGLTFFIVGFCISWNAPATNNPIFAEVVPERSRATVYALDRSVESVLASFAPAIVGLLAEKVYGYVPFPSKSYDISATAATTDRRNAKALAEALYTAVGVPMAICCSVYTMLYWTYPRDRDKALLQSEYENLQQEVGALEMSSELKQDYSLGGNAGDRENSHLLATES